MRDSKPVIDSKRKPKQKAMVVYLDDEHWNALEGLAQRERMSKQDFVKHLIRLTHSVAFGKGSPFLSVESLIRSKAG